MNISIFPLEKWKLNDKIYDIAEFSLQFFENRF